MRLLEILVVVAIIVCSLFWLFKKGDARLKFLLALVSSFITALQILLEGYRTAMLPLYLLLAWLLLYAGFRWWRPSPSTKQTKHKIAHGLLLVCFVCSLLLAALLPWLMPVFQLPAPEGPFAVGSRSFAWAYHNNGDVAHSFPAENTTLTVRFYYPAEPVHGAATMPYADDQTLQAAADESRVPGAIFDSLKLVKTTIVQNAPVARQQVSYPVVLFTPAEGVPVLSYTILLQNLASHGFIVASIGLVEPTLEAHIVGTQTSSDQSLNPFWLPKIHFVLDRLQQLNQQSNTTELLAGKLDLQHIGLLGHSYGGAAVPLALQQEPRLQAGIDMDGIFYGSASIANGVGKPFLFMDTTSSRQGYSAQLVGGQAQYQSYQQVRARKTAILMHGGYELTIDGIWHLGFSDFNHYSPLLALVSPLNQQQADQIINSYVTAFFEQYLEHKTSPLLSPGSHPFPQATLMQGSQ